MSEAKQYSALYKYKNLDGLQNSLIAIRSVLNAFLDAKNITPTLIPFQEGKGDPLAQYGYAGIIFHSEAGPVLPIEIREHDKESFNYETYVQVEDK